MRARRPPVKNKIGKPFEELSGAEHLFLKFAVITGHKDRALPCIESLHFCKEGAAASIYWLSRKPGNKASNYKIVPYRDLDLTLIGVGC